MAADLDWDEAVAALGIAAKAIACAAARATPENAGECEQLALQQLTEAFAQQVRVSVVAPEATSGKPSDEAAALLSQLPAVGSKLH